MKIAVAYDKGMVFGHFGETEQFEVYDVDGATITKRELRGTDGKSHVALIGLLIDWKIDVVMVGGIGTHAIDLMNENGIKVFAGVTGDTEANVKDYLNGSLKYNMGMVHQCSHH